MNAIDFLTEHRAQFACRQNCTTAEKLGNQLIWAILYNATEHLKERGNPVEHNWINLWY